MVKTERSIQIWIFLSERTRQGRPMSNTSWRPTFHFKRKGNYGAASPVRRVSAAVRQEIEAKYCTQAGFRPRFSKRAEKDAQLDMLRAGWGD